MQELVRCRCGRYTNYGLSCSQCRTEAFSTDDVVVDKDSDEQKELKEYTIIELEEEEED